MATPAHFRLQMYFSSPRYGWSERLDFAAGGSVSTLKTTCQNIILPRRLNFLPWNCQLDYAKLTNTDSPRDAASVLPSYPLLGDYGFIAESPGPPDHILADDAFNFSPNATRDCFVMRMEGTTTIPGRKWALRFIHGVPDDEVHGDALGATVDELSAPPDVLVRYPVAMDTVSWADRVSNYLYYVKTLTQIPTGESLIPIDNVTVARFSSHKVGRPFGLQRGRAFRV